MDLLLTDADLSLELGEVLVSSDPVVEFSDRVEGGQSFGDGQLLVVLEG